MSEIVKIGKVIEGFRVMLEGTLPTSTKVGRGKAPDNHEGGYVTVSVSTTAAREEGGWGNPEGSTRVRVVLSTAGVTDEQANAIMDHCIAATFSNDGAGAYTNPITADDHVVWERTKVADVGSANEGTRYQRTALLDLWASATA